MTFDEILDLALVDPLQVKEYLEKEMEAEGLSIIIQLDKIIGLTESIRRAA